MLNNADRGYASAEDRLELKEADRGQRTAFRTAGTLRGLERKASSISVGKKGARLEALGLFKGAVPNRSWKPGKVWCARDGIFPQTPKCLNQFAPYESSLEALAHLHLSVDCRIAQYVCQPPALYYWMPIETGGVVKREYNADFVALTTDGKLIVIDAKARRFARGSKWARREPFIREAYYRDHDATFLVWTETELRAEPRLTNARTIFRHRFEPVSRTPEIKVRNALVDAGGFSNLADLCREACAGGDIAVSEAYSAVMRLTLKGELKLCPKERFNAATRVEFKGDPSRDLL